MPPTRTMRAVGAKVAVGVAPAGVTVTMGLLVSIMVTIGIVSQCNAYGYFYRTQVAPRLSAQAHGARLALLLHKAGCASAIRASSGHSACTTFAPTARQ